MSTVTGVSSGTTNSTQPNKNVLGKDDFLKMLIAQLKNQDPLNPLDGSNFAAQLAQFSSLEQLQNMNTQLGSLGSSLTSLNNSQAASFIGNGIYAKGNNLNVNGPSTNIVYNLSQNVQKGTIRIYDSQGSLVQTLPFGSQNAGNNVMNWNSSRVKPGTYTFDVSAVDSKGNAVSTNTIIAGLVTGVTFKNNIPYLSVNGQDIAFGDVISVMKSGN
jgi:flagellar basal-body rod modification protein FlgD